MPLSFSLQKENQLRRIAIAIQHKDIPDADLHLPKGAGTAAPGSILKANGSGGIVWEQVKKENLTGLSGAPDGSQVVVLGTGFAYTQGFAIGTMTITDNNNGFALTAATNPDLTSDGDYKVFSGTGAPWAPHAVMDGVTFTVDRLTVARTGVYRLESWLDITQFPTNSATVALKYRVNGTTFGARKTKTKSNSAGDSGQLNAFAITTFNAGDYIQLMMASTATGNIIINSGLFTVTMVKGL